MPPIQLKVDGVRIGSRSQTKIAVVYLKDVANPQIVAEEPYFIVKVSINGSLSELAPAQARARGKEHKEIKPEDRRRLELALQKVLAPKISRVIKKLQSFNSDIINFGEQFRVQHYRQWQKQQWKQIFSKVRFKVMVKAKIERDGTLR